MSTITFRELTDKEEKDLQYKYRGTVVNVDGIDYLLNDDIYFKFEDYIYHIDCSVDYDSDVLCDSFINVRRSNTTTTFEVEYDVVDFRDPNASHTISGDELDVVAAHIRNTAIPHSPKKALTCSIVKDNYDNFLDQYYDLPDNVRNKDDVECLFENTYADVESLLDTMNRTIDENELAQIQTKVDSILDNARKQLNIN